uniref:Dynein regulatory complex protein 12 n=1 Tax=Crocodylus porosus TaxID=8502 RepID=A0A7M4E7T9_CROPO
PAPNPKPGGARGCSRQLCRRNAASVWPGSADKKRAQGRVLTRRSLPVLRRDVARQAKADSEGLQLRLQELEQELEAAREDKRDIYEGGSELVGVQGTPAVCRQESQQAREESQRALGEKDRSLTELQAKIDTMKTEYEQILHGSLDGVLAKLASAKLRWEREATAIHMENKERLRDFGLNPLEM